MNYQLLRDEILTGPLATDCAGKSDAEIADILNSRRFPGIKSRFVTARTILAEVPSGAAILDKLEAVAPSIPDLKWAMRFIVGDLGIDIGHPGTRLNIETLASAGVITPEESHALLQMADATVSRAEIIGLVAVTAGDVSRALRGPW
jgi:hypothetical protein